MSDGTHDETDPMHRVHRAGWPGPEVHAQAEQLQRDECTDTLRALAVPAPADTFLRFRRRAAVVQGTRMLFESQVIGFWVVLDAILRMLLGARPASDRQARPKSAMQGEGV